jgi:N-acetylneuraminic acid mutarotase
MLFVAGFASIPAFAQANEWTWMGGSSTLNEVAGGCCRPPVYGDLGKPAPANIPGAREWAASWTDKNGKLWLYGGNGTISVGLGGWLNDVWVFDPAINEWAWMGGSNTLTNQSAVRGTLGVFSAANTPGGRGNATIWTGSDGTFWLFGGFRNDWLNDLWKFDPSLNQWAWMGGSDSGAAPGVYGTLGVAAAGNVPAPRLNAASWIDTYGNLWLFGGEGEDSPGSFYFNDLWEFDVTKGEWAWMGGSNTKPPPGGQPGVYGSLGSPSSGSVPGGRWQAASWTDSAGNFWLFGGEGADANGNNGLLNDLWEFSPSTKMWTWMGGDSTFSCGQNINDSCAVFGTFGAPGSGTIPGGRKGATGWVDNSGDLWLFGGYVYDNLAGPDGDAFKALHGYINDLWKFDPTSNQWAWMGGSIFSQLFGTPGFYGSLGVPASGDVPGGRTYASSWTDTNGNLWLFGGNGDDAQGYLGSLNDLWEYKPSNLPLPVTATPTFVVRDDTNGTPQIWFSDATNGAYFLYTLDGTTPTTSSTVYRGGIPIQSTETIKVIAVASGCYPSAVASSTYTNSPVTATPDFSPPGGIYTTPQTVAISDATPGAVIYYTTDGSTPSTLSAVYSGPISVSKNEVVQAFAGAAGFGYSSVVSASYAISLPTFTLATSQISLTISSGGQGSVNVVVFPQNGFNSPVSFACSGLPSGASCTFNPATVTPAGSGVTTTLTISTPGKSAALHREGYRYWPETSLALVVCIVGWRKGRKMDRLVVLAAIIIGLGVVSGCGGGGAGGGSTTPTPTPTPTATTSTVTVTATSGSLQQSVNLSLTVN